MNATRAATIRLRSSFDGAVSLGRVQTPTLALLARREEEIRAFKPEPYWLVDALFEPTTGEPGRRYAGRYHAGAQPRMKTAADRRTPDQLDEPVERVVDVAAEEVEIGDQGLRVDVVGARRPRPRGRP